MIMKTNHAELALLAENIGANVAFECPEHENETAYLHIEGDQINDIVAFSKSLKGKMLFSMLNRGK